MDSAEPTPETARGAPLAGVRVIDLSRVLAGPLGTQILADLGADVVKVERPGSGDELRAWGPPFAADGESVYFLAANRGKRSLTLDLATEEGRRILRELAAGADVVVENFRAGTMERLGLGYDDLRARNPRLVYCALTAFGDRGAYRDLPGYDILVQGMSGLMSVTGEPDGRPVRAGVAVADVVGGLYLAIGLLAALAERERTGLGTRLDLSLLDAQLAANVNVAHNYLVAGARPERLGNAHPSVVPYEAFPTDDGELVLAVTTDAQWRRFCAAAGLESLVDDPRAATNADRVANRRWVTDAITDALAARPAAEWVAVLRAADVPCGPVSTIDEILEDPVVRDGDLLTTFPWAGGAATVVGSPLRLGGSRPGPATPPPRLGEHTEEILRERLGMTPAEVDALRRDGVV